jgi:anion-transporting  ArsA/GET3 family ATPase
MYYKLGRAGKALDRFGVIDFATTIAPGVRDVLLTGKVYEAVQRPRRIEKRADKRTDKRDSHDAITYDAVVLDAPPTGRICQFLGVNSELAGLAKVGPIKNQADKVMDLLRSPRTAVHLVTILEEMPVQETSDGIAQLREAGLPVGGVVVNLVRPRALSPSALAEVRTGQVDPTAITADLTRAKVDVDAELVTSLIDEAHDHAVRRQLEDEQRELVAAEGLPTYELPRLPGGIDMGALLDLAQMLREQGMA